MNVRFAQWAGAALTALALVSCTSMHEGGQPEYRTAGKVQPLDVPPELTQPGRDDRYSVPDVSPLGVATFSTYSTDRNGQRTGATDVLPDVAKFRIERDGSERWLVVPYPAEKVWPMLKEFWQENGFLIASENPATGVMETDWAENRAKIPMDGIRSVLAKVLDTAYSTAERDKFRTRLERGTDPNTTEVYISHRGMVEVTVNTMQSRGYDDTRWQPRNPDPGLEAEFLRRLMLRLGLDDSQAKAKLAAPVTKEERARFTPVANGVGKLEVLEPFDRAWRRVGLALDRLGFTVEDRDRSKGFYFVRYADPEVQGKKAEGFLSKLAFWRSSDKPKTAEQYRVRVSGPDNVNVSEVQLLGQDAAVVNPETANRILTLLFEQLR